MEGFNSGYGVGGVLSSNDVNYGAPQINIGNDFIDLDGDVVFEVENPADLNSESIQLMGEGSGLVKKWSEGSNGGGGGGGGKEDLVAMEEVPKVCILFDYHYLIVLIVFLYFQFVKWQGSISDGSEWSVGVAVSFLF